LILTQAKEDAMKRATKLKVAAVLVALVPFFGVESQAQTAGTKPVPANQPKPAPAATAAAKAVNAPAMTEFRKAGIGTTADDLKKEWGKPEVEDKSGFIFQFSEKEMAQVALDADQKVDTIAVTFRDGAGAPKAQEVFGPKEKIERKGDGGVFHMVRYPEAGYWVSYFSQGDGKTVIITYKKI
jgi:hypothetical protein